jgi:hypothetical protein
MNEAITCQGRLIQQSDFCWLGNVVQGYPDWSRHKITKHICIQWGWHTHSGQLKTFPKGFTAPDLKPIEKPLKSLTPLSIHIPAPNSYEDNCMGYYLNRHHYLGFNQTVGENIKYLVRDRSVQDISCLLFGSAAWNSAPRDSFIGWNGKTREEKIELKKSRVCLKEQKTEFCKRLNSM